MEASPSFSEKISQFFNPATQVEYDNRRQQIKNTVTFVVVTGLIAYFRKSLERNLSRMVETA